MSFSVTNRVVLRDNFGRFKADCLEAMGETIADAVQEGAQLSRDMAPLGVKDDPRSPHIKDSITPVVISRTQGLWGSSARHAMAVEKGSVRHFQTGKVSFFWEEQGRMWDPGENLIDHPATAAQPFLEPAYRSVMKRIMSIAERHYP